MYERTYGSKAKPGEYRRTADIAKDIRADIKAAVAKGDLPGTTKNYTVKSKSFSGGSSIDVRAVDLPGMWTTGISYRYGDGGREVDVLTEEGKRVEQILKQIHGSYNYDGSEAMVDYYDVNFYGQAEVIGTWEQSYRDRQRAAKAAAKEASAA